MHYKELCMNQREEQEMRIRLGPWMGFESEAHFAANFDPKGKTNSLSPEQIFAKYNVKDMSNVDESHMMDDLLSSSDPESGYVGENMICDTLSHNVINSLNGVKDSPTQRYNLLSETEDSYKKEISEGGVAGNYYLKLYQYLLQACGQMAV